jgi:tRNA G46 methylase TrmB
MPTKNNQNVTADWFENPQNDIEIEIGCAYGTVLFRLANQKPQTKFIGIEINKERYRRASQRVNSSVPNLKFFHGDAVDIICNSIPGNSISEYHIYFPTGFYIDFNNNKRILFSSNLIDKLYSTLKNGGVLRLLTDQKKVFKEVYDLLELYPFWSTKYKPLPIDLPVGYMAGSELEFEYRPIKTIYSLFLTK